MAIKKVGQITHQKSGIVVDYYLDGTTFTCRCLEKTFSAPEAKVLEATVTDYCEHWMTLDWHPVICVSCSNSDGWGHSKRTGLFMEIERFYVSRSPAGRLLKCEWEIEPEHRKAAAGEASGGDKTLTLTTFPLAAPLRRGKAETWLNYDEVTWNKLNLFADGIQAIYANVVQLLNTKEGNKQLASPSGNLPLLLKA